MSDVIIGRHTYYDPSLRVRSWGEQSKLNIGAFCSIADNVEIFLGGNHDYERVSTFPFFEKGFGGKSGTYSNGDVVIGNDVWIGSGAKILSGVSIGDGAVVGAFSVVTKDILPYAIVGGNPARTIKWRFRPEKIKALQEMQWWNWSDEQIKENIKFITGDDL